MANSHNPTYFADGFIPREVLVDIRNAEIPALRRIVSGHQQILGEHVQTRPQGLLHVHHLGLDGEPPRIGDKDRDESRADDCRNDQGNQQLDQTKAFLPCT